MNAGISNPVFKPGRISALIFYSTVKQINKTTRIK